ncbi:hypothetical protein CAOG_07036 [Capsaspora owczarzaki ATCC 30864]|uniref:Methyltransferase type 11 domain-containing protein n=1 Tax=Capsaspora owczarzaki (strain ATCC 30864) TaxID=595528 RepID=A0A0D2X4W4_CAPO3|nr:hypothetical protein CAOG_07036 [Capsaspora owczarzaki ATCC 30864]KJE96764.1 hypothetical protein CAOG_007036 [Capsaspora owczarzaki ATCC 30864]|eukprot:XP_004343760.1 hypothetical protein CAOG_07036 [Capsaspora owczarzaki ATCC 30864]
MLHRGASKFKIKLAYGLAVIAWLLANANQVAKAQAAESISQPDTAEPWSTSTLWTNTYQHEFCTQTRALLAARIQAEQIQAKPAPPPRDIPGHMLDEFTLNGQIPVSRYYVDDTNGGQGTHIGYSRNQIDQLVSQFKERLRKIKGTRVELPVADATVVVPRAMHEDWVLRALSETIRTGDRVVVYGSMTPTYEAMALACGAAAVVTSEYNALTYQHPNITTVTPDVLQSMPFLHEHGLFDVAVSITSFDHDGLGRYGDPVHPAADLLAMQNVRCVLKPGGRLVLTVPVGPDGLAWNLHRRYGPLRLPLLIQDWQVRRRIGWSSERYSDPQGRMNQVYEPVFVLESAFDAKRTEL